MFLKEAAVYAFEVLLPKATPIIPRTNLGRHLAYENRIRQNILRFHLERNLSSHGHDRFTLKRLYYRIESDFRLLATNLVNVPSLQSVEKIEGVTNFQNKTGRRYGFDSEVMIENQLLCDLFDGRIEKPRLSGFESGSPIRLFSIDRNEFLDRFSHDSPRIFTEPKEW